MSDRIRYVLALVVGLLAIPGLALAAGSALSSDEPEETTGVLGTAAITPAAEAAAISAEDLVRGCGVEGHYLVELEAATAIDDIQQAALNALRPICDEAGLPLPAAPVVEGETIVETVTVVRTVPGPTAGSAKAISPTTTAPPVDEAVGNPEAALAARGRALAAVDTAIAAGGKVEKINEAIAYIERGDAAYEAGGYDKAEDFYEEAEHEALEAQHELEHHEDDEHEDDHENDDDHEDNEHDEDAD